MGFEKTWIVLAIFLLNTTGSLAVKVNWKSVGQIVTRAGNAYSCKCYPGDSCYPAAQAWKDLNTTVNNNLLVALPPTAPCYGSVDGIQTFNAAKCADVQRHFTEEQWTYVFLKILGYSGGLMLWTVLTNPSPTMEHTGRTTPVGLLLPFPTAAALVGTTGNM